eukprot:scaffold7386_cov71-Phaeocystis_antarctica.AAC.2
MNREINVLLRRSVFVKTWKQCGKPPASHTRTAVAASRGEKHAPPTCSLAGVREDGRKGKGAACAIAAPGRPEENAGGRCG